MGFLAAGATHFRSMAFYARLLPPQLPSPAALVVISGIAEMAGGAGLLIRPLRRWAAGGLIALLVAVFPANVYMALHPDHFADLHLPAWVLYARLPLQGLFIWWIYEVGYAGVLRESGCNITGPSRPAGRSG